jgi:hypothetical protein
MALVLALAGYARFHVLDHTGDKAALIVQNLYQ